MNFPPLILSVALSAAPLGGAGPSSTAASLSQINQSMENQPLVGALGEARPIFSPSRAVLPEEISGAVNGFPPESPAVALPEIGDRNEELGARQQVAVRERRRQLIAVAEALEEGETTTYAAASAGLSQASLWRLLKLAPTGPAIERCRWLLAQPAAILAPGRSSGAPSRFRDLAKLDEVRVELKRIYLATLRAGDAGRTRGRRTGSAALTLREFADTELCPPDLAAALRAGTQPAPLMRIIREITPAVEARMRGPKHFDSARIVGRRGLFIRDANGRDIPVRAGKCWVLDDMSSNFPFWFEAPKDLGAQNRLVARHGAAIGRQGLYAWDHGSGAWLGLDLVGRVRDAYTAESILRFLRRLMEVYGKPDYLILERGVWAARSIEGFDFVEAVGDPVLQLFRAPAMAAADAAKLSGGIEELGIHLKRSKSARDKAIETAFDHYQSLFAVKARDTGAVHIGRYAGEFERGAKQMRRAAAGVKHPAELGFLHIGPHADLSWRVAEADNAARPKGERADTPSALLAAGLAEYPNAPLDAEDYAAFLPDIRELTIRGAHVEVTVEGRKFRYHTPRFTVLGDGEKVSIKCDPGAPSTPVAVYRRDRLIGFAPLSEDAPIIDLSDGPKVPDRIKAHHKFVRDEFRAIRLATREAVKRSELRDGRGGVASRGDQPTTSRKSAPRETKTAALHTPHSTPRNPQILSRPAAEDPALADFIPE